MYELAFIHQANYTLYIPPIKYMTANDDLTQQHDIVEPDENLQNTIDDQDENQIDGDEVNSDLDEIHEEAFGDDNNKTVTEEVNEDEIARVKDLTRKQQETDKSSS